MRTLRGLSQEALEERSGVSVRTIRSLEADDAARRRASTLGKLFEALELDETERADMHALYASDGVDPAVGAGISPDDPAPDRSDRSPDVDRSDQARQVAALVRGVRQRMGWTQRQLAAEAKVHYRTISNLERGATVSAHPATAFRLGQAAGLRDDELEHFLAALTGNDAPDLDESPVPEDIFGRVEELSNVSTLLDTNRLVTIVGGGGVGKTTLAKTALATRSVATAVVELADQPIGQSLARAMSEVLALDSEAPDELAAAIGGAAVVLIDNVEHLTAVDATIEALLEAAPLTSFVVTSRWTSRVASERGVVVALSPLDAAAAVTLLRERVGEFDALASWSADDEPLESICRAVDCLPLAIELVAAWSHLVSPTELLARLDAPLELLDRRSETDGRHDSARAAVGWTVELLSSDARKLFGELSIHPTSMTLQLIEHTHADISDPLGCMGELVDAGLVDVLSSVSPTRFRMLRVVREVGADLVDDDRMAELRRRRADWAIGLVDGTDARLTGSEQSTWLARLDLEREHLAAALEDLITDASPAALELAVGMWRYWQQRSMYERGRDRLSAALGVALGVGDVDDVIGASGHYGRSVLAYLGGHVDEALDDAAIALQRYRTAGDQHGAGSVHSLLGMIEQHRDRLDESERWYREGLASTAPRRAPRAYATLQANLSSLLAQRGEMDEAIELVEAAIARFETLGDARGAADNSGNMALWELAAGQPAVARSRARASQQVYDRLGDPQGQADTHLAMAEAAIYLDEFDMARTHLRSATELVDGIGDPWNRPMIAALGSWLDLLAGDTEAARSGAVRACVDADDLPYPHAQVRAHAAAALSRVEQGQDRLAAVAIDAALTHAVGHRVITAMMAALASRIVADRDDHRGAATRVGALAAEALGHLRPAAIVEYALAGVADADDVEIGLDAGPPSGGDLRSMALELVTAAFPRGA